MTWTTPQPQEEYTTILLPRADRYGRVSWKTDGTSRHFASLHYLDDNRGDWGISPPCSFGYCGDAQAWVEALIDLPPADAQRRNIDEATALMNARRRGFL